MRSMTRVGPPSKPPCFVHIGLQKTGTSYLQSIMWQSQEALRAQGLAMVPGSKSDTFTLMLALRGRLREGIDPASAYDAPVRLGELVAEERSPRLLLSEESLAPASVKQIRVLAHQLSGTEVHLVVTVRDVARQIPSVWQQLITSRGRKPFDSYLEEIVTRSAQARSFWGNQDLPAVLRRWSALAPPERTHVVTVPPSGTAPEVLLERFCSVIGVDMADLDREVVRTNESLGLVQAELLRRVNVALGDRLSQREDYRGTGKLYLSRQLLSAQEGVRAKVPVRLEGWCREVAESHIGALLAGGYDLVGSPEDLMPSPGSFTLEEPVVSEADVAQAAAAALADTLVHRHETRSRRRGGTQEEKLPGARVRRLVRRLRA
ncbi:hypothetical protein BH18ACT9_BH18ACT9_10780 [soil metagenome]